MNSLKFTLKKKIISNNNQTTTMYINQNNWIMKPMMVIEALLGLNYRALYGSKNSLPIVATLLIWTIVVIAMVLQRSTMKGQCLIFIVFDFANFAEYFLHTVLATFVFHSTPLITDERLKTIDEQLKITHKNEIWIVLRRQVWASLILLVSIETTDFLLYFLSSEQLICKSLLKVYLPLFVHNVIIIQQTLKLSYINVRLNVLHSYLERRLLNMDVTSVECSKSFREYFSLDDDSLKRILRNEKVETTEFVNIYAAIIEAAELLNKENDPQTLVSIAFAFIDSVLIISEIRMYYIPLGTNFSLLSKAFLAFRLLNSILCVFLASSVSELGYDVVNKMNATICKLMTLAHINEREKTAFEELQLVLQVRPLRYSVCGLLSYNVSSVLSFIAFCNTYILFIMQLHV